MVRSKREAVLLESRTPGQSLPPARPSGRWRVCIFLLVWTVLVTLALWWLLGSSQTAGGPDAWVVHRGDAAPQPFGERVRDWFRLLDLNFQRIYPWILLGPYAACLAWFYSLERGRLRFSLPVHAGACAFFVLASYAINTRSSMREARMVIITSLRDEQLFSGEKTNQVNVEVAQTLGGRVSGETFGKNLFTRRVGPESPSDVLAFRPSGEANSHFTNFFANFAGGLQPPVGPPELPTMRPLTTLLDLLAYGAIVGVAHSVHFYRRFREREHRALLLESNLAKARLGTLQAQLQPHFLFNSLNAVVALVRRDPKLAEATLTSLSDLLRLTLSLSERQEVSLREELNFVDRYMEIQQTRFGDRLRFEKDIEPAALDNLVPTLLLQPLVENAIRHGIEPGDKPGLVRLTASAQPGRLVLTVEDDGVGLPASHESVSLGTSGPEPAVPDRSPVPLDVTASRVDAWLPESLPSRRDKSGIGLANLRARLEALYGSEQRLELCARSSGGVSARIEIPLRTDPSMDQPGRPARG